MRVLWHTWCSNHAETLLGMIFRHVIVKTNELHKKKSLNLQLSGQTDLKMYKVESGILEMEVDFSELMI